MFVLSSPSGAGKTTLTRLLVQKEENIELSISVTTRPRRPSEVEGVHYHFKSREEFERMRDQGELLEWAEVHGNYYGTPAKPVEKAIAKGKDILFDIDYQGTRQLYKKASSDVVSIFILPPSIAEMKKRIRRRAAEDEMTIKKRLETAKHELKRWGEYDYVVINDDLDAAFADIHSILQAERMKRVRRTGVEAFAKKLQAKL
ncbi:MAG: guanylate kinase [Xanthobacteraceae bacterium]|nr:guanylate kinase [Xanthobacteraceae bacterium]MBX3522153.1 guanylate kinase [Xanthobacteraceae bacterium]MBX3534143.1 guanylate kinase [Xanthobacteraceae bacterium]MBX3548722.1 guanylate kinase [Xanthobacteraceae bacterium]MCW5674356.1 guanylate kinase [Xanthobacteraceae bacterium]